MNEKDFNCLRFNTNRTDKNTDKFNGNHGCSTEPGLSDNENRKEKTEKILIY